MAEEEVFIKLLQSHEQLDYFDYSKAVNWAIEKVKRGEETENTLMLASFREPIDRFEIRPYVSAVLNELGLEQLNYKNAIIAEAHFYVNDILNDLDLKNNLEKLKQLCVNNDYEFGLMNFYLLYYAWDGLEDCGENFYYEGVNLNNIRTVAKRDAENWIHTHVEGNPESKFEKKELTSSSPIKKKKLKQMNVFENATTQSIKKRLDKLNTDSQPQWGKMNSAQMLAHLNVAYDIAYGKKEVKMNGFTRLMMKLFVKNMVVGDEMKYKKNSRTAPYFVIADTRDFEAEKAKLWDYVQLVEKDGTAHFEGKKNPAFGKLSSREWSNQFYKHLDWHFGQFGV